MSAINSSGRPGAAAFDLKAAGFDLLPANLPVASFPPLMRLLRPFRLIPLDEPLFLWYISFWVQLQPIPVLACAHLPSTLARFAKCAQFWCNINPLDATLPGPLVCVVNKGLAQYLSPLDATLTKTWGEGGALLCRSRFQVSPQLPCNLGPLESIVSEMQIL
jgi:hypothetical protein